MRRRLRLLVEAYGGWPDILADAHVYGGGLLAAWGVSLWSPGAGLAVFGALLITLGLWRR